LSWQSNFSVWWQDLSSQKMAVNTGAGIRQKNLQTELKNSLLVLIAEMIGKQDKLTEETGNFVLEFLSTQLPGSNITKSLHTIENHLISGVKPLLKITCLHIRMNTTYASCMVLTRFLAEMLCIAGFITERDARSLHRIGAYLGLAAEDVALIIYGCQSPHSPYTILQVTEADSYDTIKASYRRLTLLYHPDKRNKDTTEEEASAKFRSIKAAFDYLSSKHN
jgi:hypothetical protein